MSDEREIKARVDDLDAVRERLEALGAEPLGGLVLEDDQLYDDAEGSLFARGCAVRIRREFPREGGAPSARLTFKGPKRVEAGAKVREEIETGVEDADALEVVLARLGLRPSFRYQKERRSYRLRGAIVALDHAPVGDFVEVEGDAELIAQVAGELGLEPARFESRSYPDLWRAAGLPSDG
jgi:adenylate cyclase class 2